MPSSLSRCTTTLPAAYEADSSQRPVRSVPTKAAFSPFGSAAVLSSFSLPVAGSMRKLASVLVLRSDANRNFFCGSTASEPGASLDRDRFHGGQLPVRWIEPIDLDLLLGGHRDVDERVGLQSHPPSNKQGRGEEQSHGDSLPCSGIKSVVWIALLYNRAIGALPQSCRTG